MGLETVWIDRRTGKSGGGATLAANPNLRISNRFESMAKLAAAYSPGQG